MSNTQGILLHIILIRVWYDSYMNEFSQMILTSFQHDSNMKSTLELQWICGEIAYGCSKCNERGEEVYFVS